MPGSDGQDQSCISPFEEFVLNLTQEQSQFSAPPFSTEREKKAIVPERRLLEDILFREGFYALVPIFIRPSYGLCHIDLAGPRCGMAKV